MTLFCVTVHSCFDYLNFCHLEELQTDFYLTIVTIKFKILMQFATDMRTPFFSSWKKARMHWFLIQRTLPANVKNLKIINHPILSPTCFSMQWFRFAYPNSDFCISLCFLYREYTWLSIVVRLRASKFEDFLIVKYLKEGHYYEMKGLWCIRQTKLQ